MYQSGTAPELMLPGWDGPISQTGLICATVPSRTRIAQVNGSSGSSRTRRGHRSGATEPGPEAGQEQRAGHDREDEDVHPVVAADDLMPGGSTTEDPEHQVRPDHRYGLHHASDHARLPPESPSSGKMVPV